MATADTPVRLEVRLPGSRPSFHEVSAAEFLIGSVAGCDLVIPGADLPPVLGVIARTEDGLRLRKLAPNLKLNVNGKSVHHAPLTDGDAIGIGSAEIRVHIPAMAAKAPAAATKPWTFNIPLGDGYTTVLDRPPTERTDAGWQASERGQRSIDHEVQERPRRPGWADTDLPSASELLAVRERRRDSDEVARHSTAAAELPRQLRELTERERQLSADRAALDAEIRAHRDDLARLDRQRAHLEARELDLNGREKQVEVSLPVLETKVRQLEQAEIQLRQDQEAIRLSQSEIEVARASAAQRLAEAERQDTLLRSLEDRLERTRQELTKQAQELAEQKARQDARERDLFLRQQQLDGRHAETALRDETVARERQQFEEQQRALDAATAQIHQLRDQVLAQANDVRNREQRLQVEKNSLDEAVRVHREDLVRLDRFRETLENREKQLASRAAEVEQQAKQVMLDLRALEDKHGQTALVEQRLREEEDRVRQLKAELEANTNALAERSANNDSQQAILVAVKAKLERLREELRVEAQAIADQRGRLETLDLAFVDKQQSHEQQAALLAAQAEQQARVQQELEVRQKEIEAAVRQLEDARRRFAADEAALALRQHDVEARGTEQVEQASTLRTRATQLLELQQRIESEQQSLAQRESALRTAEAARQELQRQLIARAEELDAQRQAADQLARQLSEQATALNRDRQQVDAELQVTRRDLEARAAELQQRESNCLHLAEKIKEAGRSLAMDRKERHATRTRWEEEHRRAAEDLARTRAELQKYKTELLTQAKAVQQALPELELRGGAALEQLAQAREQLKNHVAELHDYARQSYADLESVRAQVIAESDRLREQQAGLAKARNDHRHTVTAFRQQLIDWQSKLSEMKAGIAVGASPVSVRPNLDQDAALQIEAAGAVDRRPAIALDGKPEKVTDMRDWFRRRIHELAPSSPAGNDSAASSESAILPGTFGHASPGAAAQRAQAQVGNEVLSINQDLDPGDRKLGELLKSLALVDESTLHSLYAEARRQRRSLRQLLLAGGKLTVYQMALIETGNVDGLTIGPLGVIDRLHVTPLESVYRVIDPRSGSAIGPLVLRHLTDPGKADEFRQRFSSLAQMQHPHMAATVEVLDINGRPAALQEWLTGLPGPEWPSLVAVPGVWFRLTCQALLGLAAAHQNGMVHGAIGPHSVVLTADGLVKWTGIGEPEWLIGAKPSPNVADDLAALARMANDWATFGSKRKLARPPRPLPQPVRDVLDRWTAGEFASANEVLDALDRTGPSVPAGADTWDRLMKYAGANATDGVAWRKSA